MGNCLTCFQTTTNNNDGKTTAEPTVEPRTTSNIIDRGGKIHCIFYAITETKTHKKLIAAYFAETDELLSESPVHLTSLSTDIRNGSFKKSLVGLNGNANALGDIFASGESDK